MLIVTILMSLFPSSGWFQDENPHPREGEVNIPDLDDPEDEDDPDEPDIVHVQNNDDESTQFETLRDEPARQPEANCARGERSPPIHPESTPSSAQPKRTASKNSGSTPHNKGNKKKKNEDEDPRIEEAFQILKKSTAPTPPAPVLPKDDAFSIYGKYIPDKLRGYNQTHRVMAEHEINNVIFTYDMKELNCPPQSLNSKNVRSSTSGPTPPSPAPTPSPSVLTSGSDSRMSYHSPSIINENSTFNYTELSQVSRPLQGGTFMRLNPPAGNFN